MTLRTVTQRSVRDLVAGLPEQPDTLTTTGAVTEATWHLVDPFADHPGDAERVAALRARLAAEGRCEWCGQTQRPGCCDPDFGRDEREASDA